MTQPDPMLAKVRKLLALAENPAATPAEAEAFTAKAAQLIADYGIDQALLAQAMPERDIVGDRVVGLDAPYAQEKASLAAAIATGMRCRAVLRRRLGVDGTELSLHVFGHESDLVCVEILFTSLLLQGARELGRTPVPRGEHVAAYRRTWWAGFTSAIARRLAESEENAAREAETRFAAAGTSAALVLSDRSHDAEVAMNQTYPDLRAGARRRLSGGGALDGYASGQRADLGLGPRVSRRSRGELTG
jgi:hypothetical protein